MIKQKTKYSVRTTLTSSPVTPKTSKGAFVLEVHFKRLHFLFLSRRERHASVSKLFEDSIQAQKQLMVKVEEQIILSKQLTNIPAEVKKSIQQSAAYLEAASKILAPRITQDDEATEFAENVPPPMVINDVDFRHLTAANDITTTARNILRCCYGPEASAESLHMNDLEVIIRELLCVLYFFPSSLEHNVSLLSFVLCLEGAVAFFHGRRYEDVGRERKRILTSLQQMKHDYRKAAASKRGDSQPRKRRKMEAGEEGGNAQGQSQQSQVLFRDSQIAVQNGKEV
ncbi:unnamed protein product [Didymodactylos carnosus]|uniref:Uncharacterized protein n=1 Tax=Didymodactylos carnosus TaxID=1234261 RepID=A0A814ZKM9_9BILA|nr:unnamed protein product [Didymodactylos carnosus]CAF4009006.1 unnamed protein product [Didymodactylos carnosus]